MPLTLLTGPANAAKAGALLARYRELVDSDPVLVVPTFGDAQHYQRELASDGLIFGGEVTRFDPLIGGLGRRLGVGGRPVGKLTRQRIVRAAVAEAQLRLLAPSAASGGFADAAGDLFTELQQARVTPQRFTGALRAWGAESGRAAYAEELARLYSTYRRRLEALGLRDRAGFEWEVLDRLREQPDVWGERPLFVYGFDDLAPPQRDLVETLAQRTDAEVWVALPYEPGRVALAGGAQTVHELEPLAARHERLPARADTYAHPALHHLERRLFEPPAEQAHPDGRVRLLEAGGERAEAELVGAEVLALLHQGVAPEDIAVAVSGSRRVFEHVLAGYGIEVARDRWNDFAETRLGLGVLAFLRAGLPDGTAADVLTWLRTPGKLRSADFLDELERRMRRSEAVAATQARAAWEHGEWDPFGALDALTRALAGGPGAVLDVLVREAEAIWTAPHKRQAAVLEGGHDEDARATAALRNAARELRALDASLLSDPAELVDALATVPVRPPGGARGVLLAQPRTIRARRFRVVFLCGLQDGELPRRPPPDAFLDDDDRRALARASGLALPLKGDGLARERTLFYEACSRPEELLYLSFRTADEDGSAVAHSPFVEQVRELFTDELWDERGRRLLADVTWSAREAPTPHELARARAYEANGAEAAPLAPPRDERVLADLAARGSEPAGGVEAFAQCGVRWLVDYLLKPRPLDADPEALRRGSLAHDVLEATLARLQASTGSARLTPGSLDAVLGHLAEALEALPATISAPARRSLHADLERYLRFECTRGAGFEPARLEWEFDALELAEDVRLHGRVDRIDVGADGRAVVRDYKGRNVSASGKWAAEQRLQVALYALAARELLGLRPAGALYQPLGATDPRPRGVVLDDVPGSYVSTDRVGEGELAAVLGDARRSAVEAVRRMHAGDIRPCPQTCSPKGCAYPTICRAGVAVPEENGSDG